ncbi:hypothetical protein [Bacteroides sp. 51]|uniref:hypothetical protein n=1 Tax=Bacteroides sp. 51 TaxID=2302938 RepID=UPI0013D49942|nr:hypothetical protein [Bacteroides sp. 51]NDV80396.1 hypothetical protein [Bacteroides sp. 51]
MKKYILYTLMLLSGFSFSSCSDNDDSSSTVLDRAFMTMFIKDENRGKGSDYPYNSKAEGPNGNDIHLYWYGVHDCAGYQIRQALQPNVSGGADAWGTSAENGLLLLDTIVGPDVLDLVIKDQQYSTDFRFAIRVLSKKDDNITDFSHASKWYGHGDGRQWAEYMGIETAARYATPFCVYVDASQTTETTMRVMLNRSFQTVSEGVSEDDKVIYRERFELDENDNFVYQWLEVEASPNNPESTVGSQWRKYRLTDDDFKKGYVEIDGLQKNSVYVINVRNEHVKIKWDSYYNICSARSDGEPGEPIVITHDLTAPNRDYFDSQEAYQTAMEQHEVALKYNAKRIDFILTDFISDVTLAEGQTYYLEGGKTYCMFNNLTTCKGFVLRTHPDDVAEGKRAKILLGGMHMTGTNVNTMNLMFGRQPQAGEGGEIYMKMLEFYDIDFDCPMAFNYGDRQVDGSGNYFINMYSNGMAVHLESFVIKNCTFKRMVRGFIREQGSNYKIWDKVLIEDNQFFDCGFYNNGAGGYPWIAGSGKNTKTNLWKDFVVRNNTFFDCPFPSFFNQTAGTDTKSEPWNITFENNTLVNWNVRGTGNIFNMRGLPHNSTFNVKNNLIILTVQDGDFRASLNESGTYRMMAMAGCDIRNTVTMDDGTAGKITLNFENNYSTNAFLTKGQIFSTNAWNATGNQFGKLVNNNSATLNGTLEVIADNISPTELMVSPNPPHKANSGTDKDMHRADALDGTGGSHGVDLHYNKTDKVFNSQIYKLGVGDKRWR